MDIPDAATLKSLLDTLRDSKAWQEAQQRTAEPQSTSQPTQTVASLLSQLQQPAGCPDNRPTSPPLTDSFAPSPRPHILRAPDASTALSANGFTSPATSRITTGTDNTSYNTTTGQSTSSLTLRNDVASLTFQQALPLLAELSTDQDIIAQLTKIKTEQDDLEHKLYQEYQSIHQKYQDKLQVAQNKATMIGATGLSQHEAHMLDSAYANDLRNFTLSRVLPAWDGLQAKQQTRLHDLRIPGLNPDVATASNAEREKQRKIIHVLEGLLDK